MSRRDDDGGDGDEYVGGKPGPRPGPSGWQDGSRGVGGGGSSRSRASVGGLLLVVSFFLLGDVLWSAFAGFPFESVRPAFAYASHWTP